MTISTSLAPKITVFGATGQQGGSVIAHLIASSKPYTITGVTRDPTSSAAKALESKGIHMIKGDLASKEDVEAAVKDADYIFGTQSTFFIIGQEAELAQGKQLVDVCKGSPTLKMLLWSGVPSINKESGGMYVHSTNWDNKEEIFSYAKAQGVPVISIEPASFMENSTGHSKPRLSPNGVYAFAAATSGQAPIPLIAAVKDYGAFVVAAIEKDLPSASEVYAISCWITYDEMAKKWGEILGKEAKYDYIPAEVFVKFTNPVITDMFSYINEFGYYGSKNVESSKSLVAQDKLTTWEEWVKEQDWDKVLA